MKKPYGEDLTYIHDVGFGKFAQNGSSGLLKILRQSGTTEGRVVDLGCGTGIWARELSLAGYDVTGYDISAAMVAVARKRVPHATFRRASFVDAKLPRCVAVTALGEVFNYLFDERVGQPILSRVFAKVHDALVPNGLFVFDVAVPGRGGPKKDRVRHWEERDWAMMLLTEEDKEKRQLTRTMTTFRKVDRLYRRDHEVHRLQLYRPSDVTAELRRAGFKARTVRSYGDMPWFRGLVGFVARKARAGCV